MTTDQAESLLVENIIAEHLGRGDSDSYAAMYFTLADKILEALDKHRTAAAVAAASERIRRGEAKPHERLPRKEPE